MRTRTEHLLQALYIHSREHPSADGDVHLARKQETEQESGATDERADAEAELLRTGLATRVNGHLRLSQEGERHAADLTRRNRLAERLLQDVLQIDEPEASASACQLEHILSPAVADSICTLLGHPPICPHGKPIPPGDCCADGARDVRPVVVSLRELPIGAEGRVTFIASKTAGRIEQLAALGLTSGSTIRVQQKRPSMVIALGETHLALDDDVTREIWVRSGGSAERPARTGTG